VRVALQNGPLSPGVLGVRLNVERVRLRRHLEQMEARGLVTITGNTTTKQISLPGVPAKEAP
jgi:predicted ArsR family transcriptional regulator